MTYDTHIHSQSCILRLRLRVVLHEIGAIVEAIVPVNGRRPEPH